MIVAVEPPHRYTVFRALERLGGGVFAFSFVDQGVQSWKRESSRKRGMPASQIVARVREPEALPIGK
jgi:hypothetical protein